MNIRPTNPPRLPRIKTACADHTAEDGTRLSDIQPGLPVARFRALGGTRLMIALNITMIIIFFLCSSSHYHRCHVFLLFLTYGSWICAWEVFRMSRTTVYENGITRSSLLFGTFYPWESISKVVWATNYLGRGIAERKYGTRFNLKQEGLFFLDINNVPRFSARSNFIPKYRDILAVMPTTLTVEKNESRLNDWVPLWDDITPYWQRHPFIQAVLEFLVIVAITVAPIVNFIVFHYLNEYFFHLPQ